MKKKAVGIWINGYNRGEDRTLIDLTIHEVEEHNVLTAMLPEGKTTSFDLGTIYVSELKVVVDRHILTVSLSETIGEAEVPAVKLSDCITP